jgi:hypothetical protein
MESEQTFSTPEPTQAQNATPETNSPVTTNIDVPATDASAASESNPVDAPGVGAMPAEENSSNGTPAAASAEEPATDAPVDTNPTAAQSEEGSTPEGEDKPTADKPSAESNTNAWWDTLQFEGKEFTELRPDGTLMLKATPFAPERELQPLHPESAQATIQALSDKFKEVESKIRELSSEWNHSEDKKKLSGRVERVRDYLMHAKAIGDFTPLYRQVGLWDSQLQEGADKAYAERLALVEKAEALAASTELKKEGLNELRELGEHWKNTGYVDKDRADALWARFEAARDSFYNRRREHQESERAELQTNLDLKNELVDKAEKLAASDDWKDATNSFNELMDQWKATGRTFHEKNEALWQRFITAKNVFYDRKKHHFKEIQSEQEGNYEKKIALVERAESMSESTEWNKTTDAYNALMDEWKSIGRVPAEKTEELWARLSAAKDKFFNAKRSHFATMRVTYDDNYAQKQALVKRAETLQSSTDWRSATDEFAELMEEWKKIGPVARREQNEALWQAFNKARKTFFQRKDDDRDRRRSHMEHARVGRLSQVKEFLSQLKAELKEFEEDLADHHVSMANLGTSKIDEQIRSNLERLIAQAGPKMEKKKAKITEVEAQLAELTKEQNRKPAKEKPQPKAESAAPSPAETAPEEASADRPGDTDTSQQEVTHAPQPNESQSEAVTPAAPTAPTDSNPDDLPPGA